MYNLPVRLYRKETKRREGRWGEKRRSRRRIVSLLDRRRLLLLLFSPSFLTGVYTVQWLLYYYDYYFYYSLLDCCVHSAVSVASARWNVPVNTQRTHHHSLKRTNPKVMMVTICILLWKPKRRPFWYFEIFKLLCTSGASARDLIFFLFNRVVISRRVEPLSFCVSLATSCVENLLPPVVVLHSVSPFLHKKKVVSSVVVSSNWFCFEELFDF